VCVLVGIHGIGDRFRVVIDRKRHKLDEIQIMVELVERGFYW
jgi:phenylacetate-coenzyme A ligase PaaK-like adenylate-forming protein